MQTIKPIIIQDPVLNRPKYWPIGHYGVIGDCRTAALVAPDGSIDWCCLPHFDSPAVFCRLLDSDRGGYFRVSPVAAATSHMGYLPATNILETVFECPDGRLRMVDFMPIRHRRPSALQHVLEALPLDHNHLRAGLEREIGNDVAAAHRVNRLVTCLSGHMTVEIAVKPTFDYARAPAGIELHQLPDGAAGAVMHAGDHHMVLVVTRHHASGTSDAAQIALAERDTVLTTRIEMESGDRVNVVLQYARTSAEALATLRRLASHDYAADLDETLAYWREWAAQCVYDGPYQESVLRSALALKLCIFEPTGAIVAAPTTSLPEDIGGVRNWDYRYTWLRDSAFTLDALGQLGYCDEARDYFHFLHDLHVSHVDDLRVMYGIRGEHGAAIGEHTLEHLEGYRGSHPVRIGNGAAEQHQMDIYGEVLDAAYSYEREEGYRRGDRRIEADRDIRSLATHLATYVADHWQQKDHGIWEIRGAPRAFTYSRAMCWAALDRACALVNSHAPARAREQWAKVRDQIHEDILAHGYDTALGAFTQSYTGDDLDAANLRLPLIHFLPPDDPRVVSTIDVTAKKLGGPQGILYRYAPANPRSGESKAQAQNDVDGLPGPEGAFLACTFWLVSDLCYVHRIGDAREWFEQLLSYGSPLGLFSEELEPTTTELIGNYPQAFTHIGLINSAATLQRAQEGRLEMSHEQQTRG